MNYDEFAFFNQQLAAMLRDGIPLEGALKELSAGMKDQPLRAEMELLEGDLARGTPLKEALLRRNLPGLYRWMLEVGARSNDLPGVLTLLADHYQRAGTLWNRLKGLMVYPLIVILVSLVLTTVLSIVFSHFLSNFLGEYAIISPRVALGAMWGPPIVLGVVALLGIIGISNPTWRARLRWRIPAFREASLAQLASGISLRLRTGTTLPEALALAETLESNSPAAAALAQWRLMVEAGHGKPAQWQTALPPFPPMFLWLVQKGGENLSAGFQKAAEI